MVWIKMSHTLSVSATQQLHRLVMEQKNKVHDFESRLEAIINPSLRVDGSTNNGKDAWQEKRT